MGNAQESARTVALVLGMHRGGTSVLARLVGELGATLPSDPNPPSTDNPEGYWEPAGIVHLHDRLLFAADSAWLDTRVLRLDALGADVRRDFVERIQAALATSFGSSGCFVLKDPRMCRMVGFYRPLLAALEAEPRVVIALRAPGEVAASLQARNQISPDYAGLLWARHLVDAERDTRDLPRIVVDYDDVMRDWTKPARRIARLVGPALVVPGSMPHIRPGLRHHEGAASARFSAPLGDLLGELHDTLGRLDVEPGAATAAKMDRLAGELAQAQLRVANELTVEFCFQRLTSPYDMVAPPDPLAERRNLSAALQRLHARSWARE